MADFPQDLWSQYYMSTAHDVPGDNTVANGADYNAIINEMVATQAFISSTFTDNAIQNSTPILNTLGWSLYADAAQATPVDGIGGVANLTWDRSSTLPLSLKYSFILTKDAANRQGQGVAYDFTLPRALVGGVVEVLLEYQSGGAYASGDARVYLYDVTNSALITPLVTSVPSGTGALATSFTATTSTQYRLVLHVASTNAGYWTLRANRIRVGRPVRWSQLVQTPTTLSGYGITDAAPKGLVTASGLTLNPARLLGRTTALAGAVEEISVGSGLTLSGGTLSYSGGATIGGSITTSQVAVGAGANQLAGSANLTWDGADLKVLSDPVMRRSRFAVNVKDNGAVGDGVTDDSTAIYNAALLSDGESLYLPPGEYYWNSTKTISGVELHVTGPGARIKFGPLGVLNLVGCNNSTIEDIHFVGTMGSATQASLAVSGVTAYFATPTYNDGTDSIDGTDFQHVLTGDSLRINPLALPDRITRNVVSGLIQLDAAKRYVVVYEPDFTSGIGSNDTIITRYDSIGTLLGTHELADSSTWYHLISGTDSIKISVGTYHFYHSALNQDCLYDLSKVKIYELINDAATVDINGSSVGNATRLLLNVCDSVTVRGCTFSMHDMSAIKFVTCTRSLFTQNTIRTSWQGVTFDTGNYNLCSENKIDLQLLDLAGNAIDNRWLRMRGIGGSSEDDLTARGNYIRGASWAIEILTYSHHKTTRVLNNDIQAPFVGISCADGINNVVEHNTIQLSVSGVFGIELAGGADPCEAPTCAFNTITMASFTRETVGVSLSNAARAQVVHNQIKASIGVFISNPGTGSGRFTVSKNEITYGLHGVHAQHDDISVEYNSVRWFQGWNGFGLSQSAAIYIDSGIGYRSLISRNYLEATATYGIRTNQGSLVYIENNTIFDLVGPNTGRQFESIIAPNTVRPTWLRIHNNVWMTWGTASSTMVVSGGEIAGSSLSTFGNRTEFYVCDELANYGTPANWDTRKLYGNYFDGLISVSGGFKLQEGINTMCLALDSKATSMYLQYRNSSAATLGYAGFLSASQFDILGAGAQNIAIFTATAPSTPATTEVRIGAGQIKAGAGISCTTLTATGTITASFPGNAIDVIGSALSPAYIKIDQTANAGGKVWRFGNTGGVNYTTFDIINTTDGVIAFTMAPTGAATFASSVGCTTLTSTVADATIGLKANGATGKLVAYGYYNPAIGALINSLTASELAFLPMTLQSSQFYFEQGVTTFRGPSPGTPAATEVLIGNGAIKAGGNITCVGYVSAVSTTASNVCLDAENLSSAGYGGYISGGGGGVNLYSFVVADYAGVARFRIGGDGNGYFTGSVSCTALTASGRATVDDLKVGDGSTYVGYLTYGSSFFTLNAQSNHGLRFNTNDTLALTLATTGAATFASDISQAGASYHYLRGDASTDGSVRFSSQSVGTMLIEKRASGSWVSIGSFA